MLSDSVRPRQYRAPLATFRPRHIGDDEEQQQYQWHKCCRAIVGQIVRNECRDPRECESGIRPLFHSGQTRCDEGDRAKEFGDTKDNAELLRITHVRKSLDRLRIARQVAECGKDRYRGQQAGGSPVSYSACHMGCVVLGKIVLGR